MRKTRTGVAAILIAGCALTALAGCVVVQREQKTWMAPKGQYGGFRDFLARTAQPGFDDINGAAKRTIPEDVVAAMAHCMADVIVSPIDPQDLARLDAAARGEAPAPASVMQGAKDALDRLRGKSGADPVALLRARCPETVETYESYFGLYDTP